MILSHFHCGGLLKPLKNHSGVDARTCRLRKYESRGFARIRGNAGKQTVRVPWKLPKDKKVEVLAKNGSRSTN